jgi:hypothetical protein
MAVMAWIQRVPIRTLQLGKWCDWRGEGMLSMPDLTSNYIPGPKKVVKWNIWSEGGKWDLVLKGFIS